MDAASIYITTVKSEEKTGTNAGDKMDGQAMVGLTQSHLVQAFCLNTPPPITQTQQAVVQTQTEEHQPLLA